MRYCFIINPVAGDVKNLEKYGDVIKEFCEKKELDYEIFVTEGCEHATEIARSCAEKGDSVRIFSCGGDGTLFEVLNGIVGYDNVELGCMPCGSGNDYVKCYGDKKEFFDLESYVFSDSIPVDLISVDLGEMGKKYSLNITSLGLDAMICNQADKYIRSGKYSGSKAYDKAMVKCLFGKRDNDLKITIDDDETIEGSFLFSIAASGICYGGGYHSAPMADPTDGILDFILIKSVPFIKLPFLIGAYKDGTYINKRRFKKIMHLRKGKKMLVESRKPAVINVDGECFTRESVTLELLAGKIKFIVPPAYFKKNAENS